MGGFAAAVIAFAASGALLVYRMNAIVEAPENHFASSGLQNAGHRDVNRSGDHFFRVVHYYHRAVVEIGYALVIFLPFLEDKDAHHLAGEYDWLQGVGK